MIKHVIILLGKIDALKYLLELGGNPSCMVSSSGDDDFEDSVNSVLDYAISSSDMKAQDTVTVVKILLEAGANPNSMGKYHIHL